MALWVCTYSGKIYEVYSFLKDKNSYQVLENSSANSWKIILVPHNQVLEEFYSPNSVFCI
jgi:hypothetical protein